MPGMESAKSVSLFSSRPLRRSGGHDRPGDVLRVLRGQPLALQPAQGAVHPDEGRDAHLEVQVGAVVLDQGPQQARHIDHPEFLQR